MPAKYTGNNKQTSVPSPKQTGIKVTKKTVNMKELYPVNGFLSYLDSSLFRTWNTCLLVVAGIFSGHFSFSS